MKAKKPFLLTDISSSVRVKVSTQGYGKKEFIDGVQVSPINRFAGEDGTFEELCRVTDDGKLEAFPDFQVKQMSRSKLLPNAIKAWHLHFSQEDVWYVAPEDHMLLGLWDVRDNSETKGKTMRVVLGAGRSQLVYIPRGVAHGVANIAPREGNVIYFVNQHFDVKNPDERRLPWDVCGADFWIPERG
jgi:dTDP-4-dehydrorhamnose 3,5-epimerase